MSRSTWARPVAVEITMGKKLMKRAKLAPLFIVWLGLTVAFELSFGHFVLGLPREKLAADYNVLGGGLLPFGLILLTLSPLAAARLSAYRSRVSRRSESTAGRAA